MMPDSTNTTSGNESIGDEEFNISEMLSETLNLVNSSSRGFVLRIVKLLFTVSTLLGTHDWARVAPIVWRSRLLLLDSDFSSSVEERKKKDMGSLIPLVCYLVMQCAEKNPLGFRGMVEVDMRRYLSFSLDIFLLYADDDLFIVRTIRRVLNRCRN
jgi:hypothetical protein